MDWWEKINSYIVRRRILFLAITVALTGLSIVLTPSLKTMGDPTEYLPRDNPDVAFWLSLNEKFGALNTLMVGLEEPSGEISIEGLTTLQKVTESLNGLKSDGVIQARSITNLETMVESEDGILESDYLVQAIPKTKEELEALKQRILSNTQAPGSLVNYSLSAYVILIRMDIRKDVRHIAKLVRDKVESEKGILKPYYFGAAFVSNLITRNIYKSLTWIIPLFGLVLILFLAVGLRSLAMIAILFISSGVPILWWLAFMSLLGYEVSTPTLNGALILLVVGALFFGGGLGRYASQRIPSISFRSYLAIFAIVLGFCALFLYHLRLSISLPYLANLAQTMVFGIIGIGLFGLFGFIPMVSYLRKTDTQAGMNQTGYSEIVRWLVFAGLAVIGVIGTTRIDFYMSLPEIFSKQDEVGLSIGFFNRHFGGNEFLQIYIKGDFRRPEDAARLMRFTDFLEGSREFADVRSISQVLGFLAHGFSGYYRIPKVKEGLDNIWFMLEGVEDIKALVTDDRKEAMVVARIPHGKEREIERLKKVVDDAIEMSKGIDLDSTKARLHGLAKKYSIDLSEEDIDSLVRNTVNWKMSPDANDMINQAYQSVKSYLMSPQAPFNPLEAEWENIRKTLDIQDSNRLEKIQQTLSEMKTLTDKDPEFIKKVAETIDTRATDALFSLVINRNLSLLQKKQLPEVFITRVKGILCEILGDGAGETNEISFRVSGFQLVLPDLKSHMLYGLIFAVCILSMVTGLALSLFVKNIWLTPVAFLSGIGGLGIGGITGVMVDGGSATLYLLPSIVSVLFATSNNGISLRYMLFICIGLSLSAMTLILTDVMPVIRLALVMGIAIVVGIIGSYVVRKRYS